MNHFLSLLFLRGYLVFLSKKAWIVITGALYILGRLHQLLVFFFILLSDNNHE